MMGSGKRLSDDSGKLGLSKCVEVCYEKTCF